MEELNDFIIFVGRFHPLVVHLPIGFIMLGLAMHFMAKTKRFQSLEGSVNFTLFLGGLSGIAACILGFMLSSEGGYNEEALESHEIAGIAVTVMTFVFLVLRNFSIRNQVLHFILGLATFVVLSATGHLGGNITHGSSYLFQYAPNPIRAIAGFPPKAEKKESKKIENVDSVYVFEDVVQPMFDAKCISCHNSEKKKGELLLTSFAEMMQGGKTGAAIVAGNLTSSELFTRITLPHEDEKFMPPEGKTPLNKEEMKLISWWIEKGAKPQASLTMLEASAEETKQIEAYLGIGSYASLLNQPIEAVSAEILQELAQNGLKAIPIANEINYLDVTYKGKGQLSKSQLSLLEEIAAHIVWLNLENSQLTDDALEVVGNLPNLTSLKLQNNPITDAGIQYLKNLKNLEVLNLYNTQVSANSIQVLGELESLKRCYLWQTKISEDDFQELSKKYAKVTWIGQSI